MLSAFYEFILYYSNLIIQMHSDLYEFIVLYSNLINQMHSAFWIHPTL